MKLNDFLNSTELNEGIRFFKNSDNLKKMINKMEYQVLTNITNQEQREEVKEFISSAKQATKEFESVEEEFKTGDKQKAKKRYKELKIKYTPILGKLDKPFMQMLKQYGGSFIYFGIMQIFSWLIIPNLLGKVAPRLTK
jgi:pyoverdine/dityrosine biosynthesis protein Dit1